MRGARSRQRSRGAEEQRSTGAQEQRSRGAQEQRSRGAQEQRSRGAQERVKINITIDYSLLTIHSLSYEPSYRRESKDLRWGTKSAINYVHLLTILDLIGYQKKYACRVRTGADAIRHYCAVPKFEIDMDQIFAFWLDRDMKSLENSGTGAGDVSGSGDVAGDFAPPLARHNFLPSNLPSNVATCVATYVAT